MKIDIATYYVCSRSLRYFPGKVI